MWMIQSSKKYVFPYFTNKINLLQSENFRTPFCVVQLESSSKTNGLYTEQGKMKIIIIINYCEKGRKNSF